jgi:hypothetical protein
MASNDSCRQHGQSNTNPEARKTQINKKFPLIFTILFSPPSVRRETSTIPKKSGGDEKKEEETIEEQARMKKVPRRSAKRREARSKVR